MECWAGMRRLNTGNRLSQAWHTIPGASAALPSSRERKRGEASRRDESRPQIDARDSSCGAGLVR
eukprot:3312117-Prymnesium_polylepis.1